jgi:hypothetical protein
MNSSDAKFIGGLGDYLCAFTVTTTQKLPNMFLILLLCSNGSCVDFYVHITSLSMQSEIGRSGETHAAPCEADSEGVEHFPVFESFLSARCFKRKSLSFRALLER